MSAITEHRMMPTYRSASLATRFQPSHSSITATHAATCATCAHLGSAETLAPLRWPSMCAHALHKCMPGVSPPKPKQANTRT